MFELNKYRCKVQINKDNGIHIMDMLSSTGKTRLARVLDDYNHFNEPVVSYSYYDYLDGKKIEDVLDPSKYRLAVIDRYDLYYGAGKDAFNAVKDKMIVLIDCKRRFDLCDHRMVNLNLTKEGITV